MHHDTTHATLIPVRSLPLKLALQQPSLDPSWRQAFILKQAVALLESYTMNIQLRVLSDSVSAWLHQQCISCFCGCTGLAMGLVAC